MDNGLIKVIRGSIPTLGALGRVLMVIFCALFVLAAAMGSQSSAQTRSLKLYYLHTGEKATIVYKRNGQYVKSGLKKVNKFLRDWRRNEPTRMDPRLLDLIWEVYRESRSKAYIHVISAYRSPKTNNMLRRRGRGVAKNSQHTLGKAMDFFLPDVKLKKLRNIGLIKQAGGVGYYPTSGSPFVHLDTGRVRHWPRMNRKQLVRVFPNGRTLHVPSDQKPLKGYKVAKANYAKYKRGSGKIVIAKEPKAKKKWSLFARSDEAEEKEDKIANTTPLPKPVKTISTPVVMAGLQVQNDPIQPEQTETAQLPLHIPIPSVAPRPQIAAVEIEKVDIPQTVEPEVIPVTEPPELEIVPLAKEQELAPAVFQQQEIVVASLDNQQNNSTAFTAVGPDGLPIDSARLAGGDETNDTLQTLTAIPALRPQLQSSNEAGTLLALADPVERDRKNGIILRGLASSNSPEQPELLETEAPIPSFRVAALSPSEIEDLRRQVSPAPSSIKPFEAPTLVRSLRPVVDVPQTPEIISDALPEPVIPAPTPKKEEFKLVETPKEEISEITVASLDLIEPGTKLNDQIAIPKANPNREVSTSERFATPQASPGSDSENIILASLDNSLTAAIPTRNPRLPSLRSTVDTQLEITTPQIEDTPTNIRPAKQRSQPTKPLSHFTLANLDENSHGKWTLIRKASIREIAEIRPPAYGRNAIRELPSIILTAGFSRDINGRSSDQFSGSSVEFLAFAKFEK